MTFYIKSVLLADAFAFKDAYNNAGYVAEVLPCREGGINQPHFRTLKITPPGNLSEQIRASVKLRNDPLFKAISNSKSKTTRAGGA